MTSTVQRSTIPPSTWSDPTAELAPSAKHGVWWPFRLLGWILASAVMSAVVIAPLDTWSQAMFGTSVFVLAFIFARFPGRYVTLVLILISSTVSLRYLYWRATTTLGNEVGVDAALGSVLFVAEAYAVLVLLLGYVQMAWPLRRKPVALPDDTSTWPTVDVFIPTYNEPLSVVRTTVLAAKALDWPADKLKIYILDDGRRDEFRAFAQRAGVGYIIRPNNKHAKAGNINHALTVTRGELIAIFDCDHIPTTSFLQLTCGWFVRDAKCAMVQTPHHFYTPDPFEKNLGNFRRVPNEGELFYGVIQKGNDLWDATFFCGSCAVIRRGPLEEVGGIAPETVTEDAHTMLKLHRRGYRAAYLDLVQAAGLATETLSSHVGQRIRWARGMAQIFRVDNPLLGRGLGLVQRLCYASAMLHFFYGIPRLIFLMAPIAYLVFDAHIFNASAETILAFALPHIAHTYLTNSRVQGAHRHSFWAEVYEATLATYITYPTTLAIISPKLGKFNVTAKGGISESDYFDMRIAAPYLILLALNLTGAGFGIWKLTQPGAESGALAVNLVWSGWAFLILTATLAVAWEKRQRRILPRVTVTLPAMVRAADRRAYACETIDLSLSGMALRLPDGNLNIQKDDLIEVTLAAGGDAPATVRVVQRVGRVLRVKLENPTIEAEEAITRAIFGRPHAWATWKAGRKEDRPILSLLTIWKHALIGFGRIPRMLTSRKGGGVLLAAAAAGALALGHDARASDPVPVPGGPTPAGPATPTPAPAPAPSADPAAAGTPSTAPTTSWSLAHLGFDDSTRKYNRRPSVRLPFFARADQVFTRAELLLEFDPALKPAGVTGVRVSMNDEPVALIPLVDLKSTTKLVIQPQLLEEKNSLSFDFVLASGHSCPTLVDVGSWRFLLGGRLETESAPLQLPNTLSILPLPFFDPSADALTPVQLVFAKVPDARDVRIGGFVAAYFGLRAGARFSFQVRYGTLPPSHAVVFVTPENAALVPDLGPITGPLVAMRTNPASDDKTGKLLVIAGRNTDELELAAARLALDFDATKGAGATVKFDAWRPTVAAHAPNDAPRWSPGGRPVPFGELATEAQRKFSGALGGTIAVEFRIPPDVFTWPEPTIDIDLAWRSSVPAGVTHPELKVEINGHFLASLPLADSPADAERQFKRLHVPASEVRGFNRFYVHVVPLESSCPNAETDVVDVEVLAESVVHLEGYESFKQMPDLKSFVDDGYPFTRIADLSETALVLPRKPLPEEVGTALSAIAHTTAVTGVPATGLTILLDDAPSDAAVGDRDILLIGVGTRLAILSTWNSLLPVGGLGRTKLEVPTIPWHARALAFLQGQALDGDLTRLIEPARAGERRAYVVGFESPFRAGRSVVSLTAATAAALPSVAELRGTTEAKQLLADVLVMSGEHRAAFRVLPGYDIGELPPFKMFLWTVANHWPVLVPSLLLTSLLFGWMLKRRLANVEYRRLARVEKA